MSTQFDPNAKLKVGANGTETDRFIQVKSDSVKLDLELILIIEGQARFGDYSGTVTVEMSHYHARRLSLAILKSIDGGGVINVSDLLPLIGSAKQ